MTPIIPEFEYILDSGFWRSYGRQSILADGFTVETTKPLATNTGLAAAGVSAGSLIHASVADLPAGVTYADGHLTINAPCALGNLHIPGGVTVQTSGRVDMTICLIEGIGVTGDRGLIHCTHSAVNDVHVSFCDIIAAQPTDRLNGFQGHHYHAYRNRIENCVDSARVHNTHNGAGYTGVIIEANYMTKLAGFLTNTQPDGFTHTDVIQVEGGEGTVIVGNNVDAWLNPLIGDYDDRHIVDPVGGPSKSPNGEALSGIMLTPNVGAISNLLVRGNWFSGGYQPVNGGTSNLAGAHLGTWTKNRFAGDAGAVTNPPYSFGFDAGIASIYCPGLELIGGVWTQVGNVEDNNVYAEDAVSGTPGAPVHVRRNA